MIHFFRHSNGKITAIQHASTFSSEDLLKLNWLLAGAEWVKEDHLSSKYIGPRTSMITPWSTNAVEITQNMGIVGIERMEEYLPELDSSDFDPMTHQRYEKLDQNLFSVSVTKQPIQNIENIAAYNQKEGLALSDEEVKYLESLSDKLGRKLTDSEVFGFSQVNSEHCRHKIFNGTFVIDGVEMKNSLFQMIKETSKQNPNQIVSAYKDNVAFIDGPVISQFAPEKADAPSEYKIKESKSILSLKAETHNFPTTVEPFNGAATGSGGEIRDRLAGGRGSIPLSGTAVYMTSYSRLNNEKPWEQNIAERKWLYQTPLEILIKASNGASDFGNKFGQPLISGSLLTFEHEEAEVLTAFDKVIMLAGGIGYGKESMAQKGEPQAGNDIIILGGDNYRIGMGGAAVSSADTGEFGSGIELNAVQRSNPEMQKRAANSIRALVELDENPIISIHDHGAGGHLNCLSELVEETGGHINLDKLPVGDPTLSAMELIGNESQERMGLVIDTKNKDLLKRVADRERAPMFEVGKVTADHQFVFESAKTGEKPMDLSLEDMFGSSPKTIMNDRRIETSYDEIITDDSKIHDYLIQVLQLEAVACKDWLTNKVDRCVGGLVAQQQTVGELQLPLSDVGVMALDFEGKDGIANAIGHAPVAGLIDAKKGAQNAIAEALTNIVWAPLKDNLNSVSLSANWMWPCKNAGEDARLYDAVEAVRDMALALKINVPTGKDSLSMAQKYNDRTVLSPGTVIISAAGHCNNIQKIIRPVAKANTGKLYYLNLSFDELQLGGSSLGQTLNKIGRSTPGICDVEGFARTFNAIQEGIKKEYIIAGHDISAGGMITCLLEMCFNSTNVGMNLDLSEIGAHNLSTLLFAENAGVIIQSKDDKLEHFLTQKGIDFKIIGHVTQELNPQLQLIYGNDSLSFSIPELRDIWYETSYHFDDKQTKNNLAKERFTYYKEQKLDYTFPTFFTGNRENRIAHNRPKAAIIREKGSNSEREMANALYQAGFDVKDVHMTDLIHGRCDFQDVQFLGAVGGFSNSDVLGSAKGWAGAFKYNEKANKALVDFFARKDTLSVGICNGCQLFLELDLINPEHEKLSKMTYNDSGKHECNFTSVKIEENNSVMLGNLAGSTLGVWISHGEGKFHLPMHENEYNIIARYGYAGYPANPNGSDYNVAMLADKEGRHLATMPHIERSFSAWNWAYYPQERRDQWSPWAQAFVNARNWIINS